jgi:hypothetical protein
MANPIGPLLPADEQFTHQVVETFATVGTDEPLAPDAIGSGVPDLP